MGSGSSSQPSSVAARRLSRESFSDPLGHARLAPEQGLGCSDMNLLRLRIATCMVALAGSGCATSGIPGSPAGEPSWSFRVVAPAEREDVGLSGLMARVAAADVVLFGEQHDDPETHRAELELLDAIGRTGRPVILSLEMFERDVQPVLDAYLAGRIDEAGLLDGSRPWPRYASDYRPLVELAKARGWPVVAANVPRPLASAIGRRGLAALDTLTAAERANAAGAIECPDDDYRARFMEQMRSHTPGSGTAPQPGDTLPTAIAQRFYLAQCVKDETMAESIVRAMRAAPRDAIVVHYTGAFHSDFAQGTAARVSRRARGADVVIITAVPVADPASAPIAPQSGRADFVIFTRRPPRPPRPPGSPGPRSRGRPDARSLP